MFSLNGPSWSLFFEYIGNILYALFIHRLSNKALTVLVILLGLGLSWFALFDVVGYGMIGVGWTLDGLNFWGGMLRMLFPFTLGMLISKISVPSRFEAHSGFAALSCWDFSVCLISKVTHRYA